MQIIQDYSAMLRMRDELKKPVVLVPTMGALHAGHEELLHEGRALADQQGGVLIASIFVNPLQFDKKEDLESYPITWEEDCECCKRCGVDILFAPQGVNGFYPEGFSLRVDEQTLSQVLCGARRLGHFQGVCTVVTRLFFLTGCGSAVFGEKDYQQLAIIKKLVRDLAFPVNIKSIPTVREYDGLALSSRNQRLSSEDRLDASRIYEALQVMAMLLEQGEREVSTCLQKVKEELQYNAKENFSIDYVEVLDALSLEPVLKVDRPVVLAIACFYGTVRLIDNKVFSLEK